MILYKLEDKKPIPVPEDKAVEWARWMARSDRHVAKDELPDDVTVSTVFLGVDHGFREEIILFETMVFGGEYDQYMWRHATWEEAEAGHQMVLESLKKDHKSVEDNNITAEQFLTNSERVDIIYDDE